MRESRLRGGFSWGKRWVEFLGGGGVKLGGGVGPVLRVGQIKGRSGAIYKGCVSLGEGWVQVWGGWES